MDKRGLVRFAAIAAAVGFAGLAVFEFALAMGAPLGRAAWGGTQRELPGGLRAASAFAIVFFAGAAVVVLRCAGYEIRRVSPRLARRGTWALAAVLPLSAVANIASQSPWEQYLLGPIALVLGALCFIVAREAHHRSTVTTDDVGDVRAA